MELIADEHIGIGPDTVGAPRDLAGARVERGNPAAHAQFAAAVSDQTLSLTTSGAIVIVSPWAMSPSLARQTSCPVLASTAIVWSSSVLKKTLPTAYAAPRLTVSQHATPCEAAAGWGSNFHFSGPPGLLRSSA